MAGNILFGGLIGVAVDAATGATQGSPPRKPKRGGGKSMICARENRKPFRTEAAEHARWSQTPNLGQRATSA
jgi:hypothetical protein